MNTRQKVAQIPSDDQSVTPERLIEGIPPLTQGVDLLCGYFCIRMIRAAASVGDDSYLEARLEAGSYEQGLKLTTVAAALRRVPGWDRLTVCQGPAENVWGGVAQAARGGRPSVLWLPRSQQYEHGHYVIATGVGTRDTGGIVREVLQVQDPTAGSRWLGREEWLQRSWGAGSRARRAFIAPEDWWP